MNEMLWPRWLWRLYYFSLWLILLILFMMLSPMLHKLLNELPKPVLYAIAGGLPPFLLIFYFLRYHKRLDSKAMEYFAAVLREHSSAPLELSPSAISYENNGKRFVLKGPFSYFAFYAFWKGGLSFYLALERGEKSPAKQNKMAHFNLPVKGRFFLPKEPSPIAFQEWKLFFKSAEQKVSGALPESKN